MSGAEGLLIGAVIGGLTNLVTNGINPLLQSSGRSAVEECRKLACSVESIKRDVEHVKRQSEELQRYDPNARHDLQVMQNVVEKLADELHLAGIDVHECESASKFAKRLGAGLSALSKKITERNKEITRLRSDLASWSGFLALMITDARRAGRRSSFDGHPQHPPMDQISLQQSHQRLIQERSAWQHHPMPHQPPTDLSYQRRHSSPHQPSSDLQQRDEYLASPHRLESGNSLHRSNDAGSSSHGSPSHSSHVNQYSNHIDRNMHQSVIHRSSTIASTHQHHVDVPHHQRSSTFPRSDHVTHSEDVQASFRDPYFPDLLI